MSYNKLVTRSEPHHQGLKSYFFVFAIISITKMFFYPPVLTSSILRNQEMILISVVNTHTGEQLRLQDNLGKILMRQLSKNIKVAKFWFLKVYMFVVKKGNNSETYAEERPEFPSSEQAWFKITVSLNLLL